MGEFEEKLLPLIKECNSEADRFILEKYKELNIDGEISEADDLFLRAMYAIKKDGITGSVELQKDIFKASFEDDELQCISNEERFYNAENYSDIIGLNVETIQGAKKVLSDALDRVLGSSVFREKTRYKKGDKDILMKKYFSLMVKESFLDPDAVSSSGAKGYFQLREGAIIDAKGFLNSKINKNVIYVENNPEDNCILGIIYYELQRSSLRDREGIELNDLDKFTLFSYNAGPGNLNDLLELYIGAYGSEEISWENFADWLSRLLGISGGPQDTNDLVYGSKYVDWFNSNNFEGSTELFIDGLDVTQGKIYEAVNYVEKINNIREYSFGEHDDIGNEEIEGTRTDTIESNGDKVEYLTRVIGKSESINVILDQEGLNRKYAKRIFEFNQGNNESFKNISSSTSIPVGVELFIPLWVSGFYKEEGEGGDTLSQAKVEKIQKGEFNFYSWLESVEILSEELKGKVFVLDPGHGAPDLGAHPVARDGAGDPIPDLQSAIKVINEEKGRTQRVKIGEGSDYLHVYESLVVVDISYRLALLLKQRGAEVHITRYNKKTGIVADMNSTTPGKNDDVYSDTGVSWDFSRGGNKIRLRRGSQIANGIYDTFTEKGGNSDDIFFLSIHADSRGNKKDLPINYRYQWSGGGKSKKGKNFANELAENTEFRGAKGISGGQGLYIINPKFNKIPASVLVELANMNNPGSAYLLRQSGTETRADGSVIRGRQQYAEALFEGIFNTLVQE